MPGLRPGILGGRGGEKERKAEREAPLGPCPKRFEAVRAAACIFAAQVPVRNIGSPAKPVEQKGMRSR